MFEEEWGNEDHYQQKKNRRGSEQINLKNEGLLHEMDSSAIRRKEDEEFEFFNELYAGISALFEQQDRQQSEGDEND